MREGIDIIRNTPVVRRITLTTLVWNLAFYGSEALIVPYLRDVIALDGQHVGWVLGVGSLIGIATAPTIAWLEGRIGPATVIVTGIVVSGLSVLAVAASSTFWEVLVVWIVLSLAQWVSFTTAIGERQRHAPAHLQARVGITGRAIAIASMTAGATGASLLAHVVELRTLYAGMGVATLLVAVALGPRLLRGPAVAGVSTDSTPSST
jgi:predicted MFS family arabinose efflux permease